MNGVANIITALGTLVTALVTLFTVIVSLRATRKVVTGNTEIHHMINQRDTDNRVFQADLVQSLTDAGVTVPKDKSLEGGS